MSLETDLVAVVRDAITNHPRTLQQAVGPSELGTPCARKLGHKLVGTPRRDRGTPWKPTIGTAMHAWMEEHFARDSFRSDNPRWWIEQQLVVGQVNGVDVTGSCDLYDQETGTVVDWKFVGRNRLTQHRRRGHPGTQYRAQAHLYGRGWQLRGMHINTVAVMFWTRDGEFADRWWWAEPYNEQVALDALTRATNILQLAQVLGSETTLGLQPMVDDYCAHCDYLNPNWSPGDPPTRGCRGLLTPPTPTTLAQALGG